MTANAAGRRSSRLPVVLILLLMAIPLLAGGYRLVTLLVGADITPENVRFFTSPVPVVLHIVGAAVYIVLGAFQFVPNIRRRNPAWHRRAGRVVIVSGLVAALSALWMTQFYALPDAAVELKGGATRAVHAREATGEERERLWTLLQTHSGYGDLDGFARRRSQTAVVVLEPRS